MDRHPVLGALRSAGKSSCARTVVGSSPTLPHQCPSDAIGRHDKLKPCFL